jgi:L-alanine-DL-glutamate epimerase-like enolase superfamily enzyme
MKIEKIEVFRVGVPWRRKYTTSYSTFGEIEHVFIKISTDDGIVGYGEVSSLPFFTGESTGTIGEVIKLLQPVIKGCSPFDLEKISNLMEKTVKYNSVAKAAIDFALYDIMGKSIGRNSICLLGGSYREKIPLSWSLTIGKPDEVAAEAVEMVEKGFDTVNLKIGVSPEEDVERLKKVRKAIGDKIHLRADANGAFTPMQAIQFIKKIEDLNMQYVEQPVPGWDLDGMAEVRRQTQVQISADESAYYPHSIVEIIRKGAADIIALKVAKMGGIRKTMQIASIAEAANIPCMMNSNFELDIGVAAASVVAASSKMVQYSCEISGPLRHQTDIFKKGVVYKDGFIIPSTVPGLGVEIDEKKLVRYKIL